MKIYVEGGGNKQLNGRIRQGIAAFLCKLKLNFKPQILLCGSGRATCKLFSKKRESDDFLLVDSESLIDPRYQQGDDSGWKPVEHIRNREVEKYKIPSEIPNEKCHLMVTCMESWFLADSDALRKVYGKNLDKGKIPKRSEIERQDRKTVQESLSKANKNGYNKARDSSKIFAQISPDKVSEACPWGKRFLNALEARQN